VCGNCRIHNTIGIAVVKLAVLGNIALARYSCPVTRVSCHSGYLSRETIAISLCHERQEA